MKIQIFAYHVDRSCATKVVMCALKTVGWSNASKLKICVCLYFHVISFPFYST